MNEISVLKFFGQCGFRFSKDEIIPAVSYLKKMIADDKVLKLYNGPNLHGIIVYSITNNEDDFLKKKTWEYIDSNPSGSVIIIEYLACVKFDLDLRNEIRNYFRIKHPEFKYALWKRFRKPVDKIVKIFKEKQLCTR